MPIWSSLHFTLGSPHMADSSMLSDMAEQCVDVPLRLCRNLKVAHHYQQLSAGLLVMRNNIALPRTPKQNE